MTSDCACLYGGEGDMPDFHQEKWVTARKAHRCCECGDTIQPGERYEYTAGKWDGTLSQYRTCAGCQDIRHSLYCDGWTYLMLWEDVTEQIFEQVGLTISCVDKCVTPEGKAKLQQRWMDYLEVPR